MQLIPAMQGLGLELAGGHDPDLVLLDLHLPGHPRRAGPRAASRPTAARNRSRGRPAADATPAQVERVESEGIVAYLTKPLELSASSSTRSVVALARRRTELMEWP